MSSRRPGWTESLGDPIRVGVVFLVAVTVVAALVGYPSALRSGSAKAGRNAELSYSDREVAGGNGLVVDQRLAYEARSRIPRNAAYHVAVGPKYAGGTPLTVPYVASYFRYFLMPRRPAEAAPWVVCYGCDVSEYGGRATVVWRGQNQLSLLEVRR